MNIDAGLDFDFGEDLLSLVAHDYTNPNGLKIKVGGDDLKYDELAKTLTVPKTLKLNIKGTLDFVNIQNTRAVATITANDKVFAKLQLYSVNLGTPENPDYDLQLDAKIMEEYKGVFPAILDMCVALGKNGAIGINGFKNVGGKWGFYAADDTDKVGGVLYSVYEKDANGKYRLDEATNAYVLLTAEEQTTYQGDRYTKYNVSYSFAKVNESINHLVTSGEAHVKGLNFVKLVNYLINKNGNGLFVNYKAHKAEAAAENDITIGDVIMNLLLKDNVGIIPAVYGLIGINQADGLDNSLVIGGEKILATTFKNLFEYNNNNIDAVSMVALAMKYFTKYQVVPAGKTYDSVAVYKEFETELYKLTARGFYAKGLSKQLMLLRPEGYITEGEKFFADNKATATTDNMKQYGYAVVEDSAGNKYLYPYVLYAELENAVKKNNVKYLSDEGFSFENGKLVLINTPDVLKQAIVGELNRTAAGYTESNYIDGKAGSLLRQAYRLGKTYVPYFDTTANSWKVEEIAAAGTSANAEIIDDIALKVIIGTKKDGDRVTYGTATVEGKVYGKTFSIKGYVNFCESDPTTDSDYNENLISEDTKKKAFEIQIINPQEQGVQP